MVAVRSTNETTPQFFEYLTPPAPPGADGSHRGRWYVGRHCPYTNNIWCGSVHALLRYRSKTAKMPKIPHWLHSNENFICLFFRPPGAANPQKGRRHVPTQATSACKIWRESARGLLRNRWPNKQKTTSASVELTQTCFPKDRRRLWRRGNLPLGDLMGKEELAQGSSNGSRTIHDLVWPSVYGDVHSGRAYS